MSYNQPISIFFFNKKGRQDLAFSKLSVLQEYTDFSQAC